MLSEIFSYLWIVILVIVVLAIIAKVIRIVPQSYAYVVERVGAYDRTCNVGLNILIPLLDRVANKVSLKEQVMDFAPQPVITKDNVTMQIDTVVYFQITDPKLFTYGVVRPLNAIENLTATTLRNIIGDLELDQTLTLILRANAEKEAAIAKATGEAEALRLVYEAQAKGVSYINEADPKKAYITLQGFKALESLSQGQSTKIIIPSELQGLAGTISALGETLKDPNEKKKD